MLYDLNVAWSPSTSASDLQRTLKFASSLGYNVVALNHTIAPPMPAQATNPLPKLQQRHAGSEADGTTATSSSSPSKGAAISKHGNYNLPTILHRATMLFTDASNSHRLPQLAQAFDLVAVRPTTEWAFQAACLSVNDAPLISLDLTQQLPFYFRPVQCMAAVRRGVRFEICYGQALRSDARGRANFVGNVMQLARATRARGLVVSSEAGSSMGLRGPKDVVNLLAIWGVASERGTEALTVTPRGIVVNEGIKRSGFRGVVDIVQVAERHDGDKMEGVETAKVQSKQKGTAAKGAEGGKKRSHGQGVSAQPDGALSKRQAKKLRVAERQAAASG